MSGSDRGDRGALIALVLVVVAVVIVALFGGTCEPFNQVVGQPASDYIKEYQKADVAKSVTSSDNFNFWLDSYAQWAMAVLSVLATGVSILAIILLRKTLRETQRATKTTRDIGEDQSRAYVHADAAELSWGSSEKPYPNVVVTIANTGQTPARWFSVRATVKLRDAEKPHPIDVASGLTPKRWNGLGGNSSLTFPVIPDGDDFKSFSFAVNSRVDALGRIEYETFFGELFYSEFYFTLRPPHKMTFKPIKPTEEDLMAFKYRDEAPQKMARNEGLVATFVYLGNSTKTEP